MSTSLDEGSSHSGVKMSMAAAYSESSEDVPSPFVDADCGGSEMDDCVDGSVIISWPGGVATPTQFSTELTAPGSDHEVSMIEKELNQAGSKEVGIEPGTYRIIDLYCLKEHISYIVM